MERSGKKYKISFEDNNIVKVIKGSFLEEDDFTISLKAFGTDETVTVGKRAIVKIQEVF